MTQAAEPLIITDKEEKLLVLKHRMATRVKSPRLTVFYENGHIDDIHLNQKFDLKAELASL